MFCSKCGSQNFDDARFCVSCSAPLNQNEQPLQPVQPMIYQAPIQPAPQMTYQQTVYHQPNITPDLPGKGLGITSMILGIVSLVLFCLLYLSIPCAIISLVLGIVSSSKAKAVGLKNGFGTAGIVTSSITIGLVFLIIILSSCSIGYKQVYFYDML